MTEPEQGDPPPPRPLSIAVAASAMVVGLGAVWVLTYVLCMLVLGGPYSPLGTTVLVLTGVAALYLLCAIWWVSFKRMLESRAYYRHHKQRTATLRAQLERQRADLENQRADLEKLMEQPHE